MKMPPVVKCLLLLNLAAFVLQLMFDGATGAVTNRGALWYVEAPTFHVFQLVTYMFLHADFGHIFFNMFALWMFGRIMEQAWGSQRFLIYYIVCGIGAGLSQELGQALGMISPYASTIGASGAVFGVMLAFGMTFPNERLFIIPFPFPIKAKWFVMIYAALELFEGMHSNDNVAHYAHLGGMVVGLFLILYWRHKVQRQRTSNYGFQQYDKGNDDGLWTRLKSMFTKKKKQPKMHISYGNDRHSDYQYNARRREESEEIDRILDKIRKGGYSSLTAAEKERLFNASQRK